MIFYWHSEYCCYIISCYDFMFVFFVLNYRFLIPAYLNKPFQSLLSQEFGLFYGKTQFRRFIGESTCQPENYPVHVPSTWLLHVVSMPPFKSFLKYFFCPLSTDGTEKI